MGESDDIPSQRCHSGNLSHRRPDQPSAAKRKLRTCSKDSIRSIETHPPATETLVLRTMATENRPFSALISDLRGHFNFTPRFVRNTRGFSKAIQPQTTLRSARLAQNTYQTGNVLENRRS